MPAISSSRRKGRARKETPLRAAPSADLQTQRAGRSGRGRQISKTKGNGRNRDSRSGSGPAELQEHLQTGAQDDSSVTLPSGVSCFLLDCLDSDSRSSDSSLSSIEEFRKADGYDEMSVCVCSGRVKNSTLLDGSHAQDLELQQPPNLSSILELSLEPEEKQEQLFTLSPIRLSPLRASSETPALAEENPCVLLKSADEKMTVNSRDEVLPPAVKKCFSEGKRLRCRKVTFSDVVSVRNLSSRECVKSQRKSRVSSSRECVKSQLKSRVSEPVRVIHFRNHSEKRAFFQRLRRTCSFMFPAKPIISTSTASDQQRATQTEQS